MHEASLAEELVNECATLAQGRPVLVVAVRCPPGMGSSELSDSFAILAEQLAESGDACLRQAQLRLAEVPAVMRCRCGFKANSARTMSPAISVYAPNADVPVNWAEVWN